MVSDVWVERGVELALELRWRRRLFVWEEELLLSLKEELSLVMEFSDSDDLWRRRLEDDELFSVSLIYEYLGMAYSSVSEFNV
ncbi:hypothetical protein L195_g063175 [Trifolium pratense]|uniref:Uncharacterized protein n=1 Tax=Trifolium pratense TaxID=57577 RepID=A0A2K3KKC7_TRIPR|nr:hypothetical protein L195_g063175 [Trifolium pratense]